MSLVRRRTKLLKSITTLILLLCAVIQLFPTPFSQVILLVTGLVGLLLYIVLLYSFIFQGFNRLGFIILTIFILYFSFSYNSFLIGLLYMGGAIYGYFSMLLAKSPGLPLFYLITFLIVLFSFIKQISIGDISYFLGLFENRNSMAIFALISIYPMLIYSKSEKRVLKFLSIFGIILSTVIIFLTDSRTSIISLIILLLILRFWKVITANKVIWNILFITFFSLIIICITILGLET
jgi:hypothetical protein